jgi:hypothetical protein
MAGGVPEAVRAAEAGWGAGNAEPVAHVATKGNLSTNGDLVAPYKFGMSPQPAPFQSSSSSPPQIPTRLERACCSNARNSAGARALPKRPCDCAGRAPVYAREVNERVLFRAHLNQDDVVKCGTSRRFGT